MASACWPSDAHRTRVIDCSSNGLRLRRAALLLFFFPRPFERRFVSRDQLRETGRDRRMRILVRAQHGERIFGFAICEQPPCAGDGAGCAVVALLRLLAFFLGLSRLFDFSGELLHRGIVRVERQRGIDLRSCLDEIATGKLLPRLARNFSMAARFFASAMRSASRIRACSSSAFRVSSSPSSAASASIRAVASSNFSDPMAATTEPNAASNACSRFLCSSSARRRAAASSAMRFRIASSSARSSVSAASTAGCSGV